MPDEHKSLIYGDSLKAKMQSLDDEKVASLAAKRQFLPLQSRIEKQKNYLERISREIETKQQHRLEILLKWIEADQELDAAHAKQVQAKHEMSILVAEQTAENAKAVNQGTVIRFQPRPRRTTDHPLSVQICSLDGIEALKSACEVVVLDAELPSCIPGFSSMDIEGQEVIKRSLSNAATEKRRLARKCKQEEDVL